MFLANISIKRPVLMTMVIMTFVVIGLFSYLRLGIDLFPNIDFPFVTALTIYPGAGPEEIETLINKPLEEEISGIEGIKSLYSIAQESVSMIFVELQLGQDVDISAIDIKDKIDAIRPYLPDDMQDPVVQKFSVGAHPIVNLSVTGPYPLDELYKVVDDKVKPELGKIPGLANIDIIGEKEREIKIELSIVRLRAYSISPLQVVMALASENLTLPAGRIERSRKEYTLRLAGEYSDVASIAATRISTPSGSIRLDRIAKIRDSFAEQREIARFNNESSIGLDIIKRSDANTVQVANGVMQTIDRIQPLLPDGVKINIAQDNSQFIRDAVADVWSNLLLGILFTAFVLFLFLHSWRGTVIAALTMPISVVASFTLLSAAGFTLNMMSLMGLAISVGILVVNAIVVLENIYRLQGQGMDMKTAASKGTGEIAIAVSAATLTNIVVFTPMAFMQGIIGPIFRQFGLTVAFATIFSLFISFTLTPMLASRPLRKMLYVVVGIITFTSVWAFLSQLAAIILVGIVLLMLILEKVGLIKKFGDLWDHWYSELAKDYRKGLNWALNHRFIVLVAVGILFVFGLSMFKFIGSEFFPSWDERVMAISVEMPAGTRLEQTNKILHRVEKELAKYPEVSTVYTSIGKSEAGGLGGGQGVQYGQVSVELLDREAGDFPPTSKVVESLRSRLADIPAAKIIVTQVTQFGGHGGGSDIEIQLQSENMDDLAIAADRSIDIIRSTGNAINVRSDWRLGKPEIVIRPDRSRLFDRGGSVQDVAMLLRTMFEGTVATYYREEGDEYDVRVQLVEEDRNRVDRVGDMLIPLRNGFVPLKDVTTIEFASGPTQVTRKNKQRMVTVSANAGRGTVGELQSEITIALELPPKPPSQVVNDILTGISTVSPRPSGKLPEGVTVFFGGEAEMMAESFSSLLQALVLAIILTYMLLAAILESYRFPFIIMMTLPLALIGVAMALVMTGKALSIISLISIVMLVGIVVNNGILLIDYTSVLRSKGRGLKEAILEACPVRLRPILMSTLATSLGMLPLALQLGSGGELRSPMAIVAIGGLLVSTPLTLFLIPVLYTIMEVKREKRALLG